MKEITVTSCFQRQVELSKNEKELSSFVEYDSKKNNQTSEARLHKSNENGGDQNPPKGSSPRENSIDPFAA
jgi:hypothetical protein